MANLPLIIVLVASPTAALRELRWQSLNRLPVSVSIALRGCKVVLPNHATGQLAQLRHSCDAALVLENQIKDSSPGWGKPVGITALVSTY